MADIAEIRDFALYVKNITKQGEESLYGKAGLCEVSFSFEKKGIHCILAPKNSGKTQLMNILAGCDCADSGEAYVYGVGILGNPEAKKRIGYLRQENTLYSDMTAVEVMSFVGETKKVESSKLYRQIKEALELVGLDSIKNKLVKNMTEYDRKKLLLAAALLGNPDILLLDEPITGKVVGERKEELEGLVRMLGKMKPVVLTTDDYKLARSLGADVVIISDGKVLAKGSFDVLEHRLASSEQHTTLEALYNSLTAASAEL